MGEWQEVIDEINAEIVDKDALILEIADVLWYVHAIKMLIAEWMQHGTPTIPQELCRSRFSRIPGDSGKVDTEHATAATDGSSRGRALAAARVLRPKDHDLSTHLPASMNCRYCRLGKIKHAFARRVGHEKRRVCIRPYERIYADCIGPVKASLRGDKYIIVFRDEHSGYAWIHPVKKINSEIALRCFKKSFPKQQGLPKIVRADRGSEFNKHFREYCIEEGIAREHGLPYSPQTRSRGERWHGTLNNGIRVSLAAAGLSLGYWHLAAEMWCHNWNTTTIMRSTGVTPAEIIRPRFPVSEQIVPFGCHAVTFRQEGRAQHKGAVKLHPNGYDGIIVGYEEEDGYQVLMVNPETSAVIRGMEVHRTRNLRVYPTRFIARREPDDIGYPHFDLFESDREQTGPTDIDRRNIPPTHPPKVPIGAFRSLRRF